MSAVSCSVESLRYWQPDTQPHQVSVGVDREQEQARTLLEQCEHWFGTAVLGIEENDVRRQGLQINRPRKRRREMRQLEPIRAPETGADACQDH